VKEDLKAADLSLIAHSFGGHSLELVQNNDQIQRVVMIAAQHGYWKYWPQKYFRYTLKILWNIMPPISKFFGYFPAKLFRLGEDIPKDVAIDWATWALNPEYLYGKVNPSEIFPSKAPLFVFSFEDDIFAPKYNVDKLFEERFGQREGMSRRHVVPSEVGLKKIGHFGFFKEEILRDSLWKDILCYLRSEK